MKLGISPNKNNERQMAVTRRLMFHGFCEVGLLGHIRIRKAANLDVLSANGVH